ncbi:MAG: hypothetical protein ACREJ0_20220 [Geminicoccaceae bacterium]
MFGMPAEVELLLSLVIRAGTILSSAPGAWFYIAWRAGLMRAWLGPAAHPATGEAT